MNFYYISNEQWGEMWIRQAEFNDVLELPSMASLDVQSRLHGTSGVLAMRGALKFRDVVLGNIGFVPPHATLLDFGCGWGDICQYFLKILIEKTYLVLLLINQILIMSMIFF